MRTTFLVRIPLEYRAKVLQEGLNLGLDSTLETMGHILSNYFGSNQPHKAETAVTKAETASETLSETPVTAPDPNLETSEHPLLETAVTPSSEGDLPKTLYGGVIYVAA